MDDLVAALARLDAYAPIQGSAFVHLDDLRALRAAYDAQAARLAAQQPIVEAAEEIAVLWPSDPKLWAWEEVEALVVAVAVRAGAVGAGEPTGD